MERLLRYMYEKEASDLILTTETTPQLRINGALEKADSEILTPKRTKELAYSILTKNQIEYFEKNKDLGFSFDIEDLCRFRINVYLQRGCVALAARRIPFEIPRIEQLGLPDIIKDFALRPNGLFLITGAVGSGKSTTLAAMIDHINDLKKSHIICIEDPIEYIHKHKMSTIEQREEGDDTLSFNHALRNVFRQSPDVIMVGEMRDLETIRLALTLAETGHLILATLHTLDAPNSITRIIDVFPATQQQQIRIQLSLVLLGVLAQQLIPAKDGSGRVPACEVMNVNSAIRNLIRENKPEQIYSVIQTGKSEGMISMRDSLEKLYEEDKISFEEASNRYPRQKGLSKIIKKPLKSAYKSQHA